MLTFQDRFRSASRRQRRITAQGTVQSNRDGGEPVSQPVTMKDLLATIMHSLMDIGQVRLMPGVSQKVLEAIKKGEPIRGLVRLY